MTPFARFWFALYVRRGCCHRRRRTASVWTAGRRHTQGGQTSPPGVGLSRSSPGLVKQRCPIHCTLIVRTAGSSSSPRGICQSFPYLDTVVVEMQRRLKLPTDCSTTRVTSTRATVAVPTAEIGRASWREGRCEYV